MVWIIGLLSFLVLAQWLLVWRLVDRLLVQARVPSLGPVRTAPPAENKPQVDPRTKLFSVKIDQ